MNDVYFYLKNLDTIDTSIPDFLSRFDIYAKALQHESRSDAQLTILTSSFIDPTLLPPTLQYRHLERSFLKRLRQLSTIIKSSSKKKVLVAGNNYGALSFCLALRAAHNNVRVQASLHGRVDLIMQINSIKGMARRFLLRTLLPKVDSLRLVDRSEIETVSQRFRLDKSKIFVAPVPIKVPSEVSNFRKVRDKQIAFVGRVHPERGIQEWTEIALKLAKRDAATNFLVIGDGPSISIMKNGLKELGNRAQFRGRLNQERLEEVWGEIGVLLSSAPSESYGLAAREALLRGVPVVARLNPTYESLAKVAPNILQTYTDPESAIQFILELLAAPLKQKHFELFRDLFIQDQEHTLSDLARSWIT